MYRGAWGRDALVVDRRNYWGGLHLGTDATARGNNATTVMLELQDKRRWSIRWRLAGSAIQSREYDELLCIEAQIRSEHGEVDPGAHPITLSILAVPA